MIFTCIFLWTFELFSFFFFGVANFIPSFLTTSDLRKCVRHLAISSFSNRSVNACVDVCMCELKQVHFNGLNGKLCIIAGEFVIDTPQKLKSKLEMVTHYSPHKY